ncbi:ribonuclease R [Nitzschia inconspicua]|uniref:exoribonuclease II n=1 Tax=Nitzschia inconspicua TaxID=303405 RepID=A0A9K3KEU9_9STRA|nr:ribonuclease R [Nitzschia inconspicua]
MTATSMNDRCWIQRDFLKEKIRVKERYWHFLESVPSTLLSRHQDAENDIFLLIPDALALRKYLPLILYLIDREREQAAKAESSISSSSMQWVVLESVVEWMDFRNMSATIVDDNTVVTPSEKASPQERSKLQMLLQQPQYQKFVVPFCDLSVRQREDDEWNIMNYDTLSIERRSQNALFRAARLLQQQWLENHNAAPSLQIYIVSGDADFVHRFPEEDGVKTILMQHLLETPNFLSVSPVLTEHTKKLVTRCEEDYAARNDPATANQSADHTAVGAQDYWSGDAIQQGLRNKTLVQGRFNVTKENPKEAMVRDAEGNSYFINQQRDGYFNRAIHQDIVVVQPLPREQWSSPVGRRRLVAIRNDENDIVEGGDDDENDYPPVPSGRVVAIVRESRRQFVATMVDTPMGDESACLVIPMDVRIPKIRIKTNTWQRFVGNRLWVQIDGWDVDSNYPSGHCVDILGPIADLETEITCLLKENHIFLEPFSAAAKACLPIQGHDWRVPESEVARRRDLRSVSIFSVDPIGCQDIDDTMHARELPNGDIEIGVHIADVSYFVQHNSALDREAQARATTFYLVDRRFDMLPGVLSSDLCSLHGNMDRLAVSTIWTFSRDFKQVKNFWYGRSVIHNVQAMTYEQAHNILHNLPPDDLTAGATPPLTAGYPVDRKRIKSLKKDLALLTKLARFLRKDREDIGGAVDLSSGDQGSELKFSLDTQGNPVRVTPKKQMEIHHTIAELMILANTYVAKTIYDRFPNSALLRIHQNVDESRFEDLKEVLKAGNINFVGSSNMKLAGSLKSAEAKTNSTVSSLFQSLATRAMSEAQYVSTGAVGDKAGLSHYGLGLEQYTHFTSPIRRYADVVVHRQLILTLTPKLNPLVKPPPGFGREALASLPDSEMISILHGEGLNSSPSTQDETDTVATKNYQTTAENPASLAVDGDIGELYSNTQVTKICDNLNQQNRMAKLSSFECQNLFLSLYFRSRTEVTQAVVTNLRVNGFFAYVPRFDFRAPVYLSDKDGNLQIDPRLLDLSPTDGLPPSAGFASSSQARKFPSGSCSLISSSESDYLDIQVPDSSKKYSLKVLDVVTVTISCDEWDTKSRIPQPRIHLIADSSEIGRFIEDNSSRKLTTSGPFSIDVQEAAATFSQRETTLHSIYSQIKSFETPTKLEVDFRYRDKIQRVDIKQRVDFAGASIIRGRVVFGGFVNPDTRSAQQEAAVQEAAEAAIERRNQVQAARARQGEYEASQRIEKEVSARMQKLAVSKRSTRIKGKGK